MTHRCRRIHGQALPRPRLGAATEHPLRGPEAPSAKDLPLRCRTLSSPRPQSPIRQYVGCGKTHPTSSPSLPRPYLRFWGGRSRRHRLQQPPKLPYANKGAKNSTFKRPVSGTPHPKIADRPQQPSTAFTAKNKAAHPTGCAVLPIFADAAPVKFPTASESASS